MPNMMREGPSLGIVPSKDKCLDTLSKRCGSSVTRIKVTRSWHQGSKVSFTCGNFASYVYRFGSWRAVCTGNKRKATWEIKFQELRRWDWLEWVPHAHRIPSIKEHTFWAITLIFNNYWTYILPPNWIKVNLSLIFARGGRFLASDEDGPLSRDGPLGIKLANK